MAPEPPSSLCFSASCLYLTPPPGHFMASYFIHGADVAWQFSARSAPRTTSAGRKQTIAAESLRGLHSHGPTTWEYSPCFGFPPPCCFFFFFKNHPTDLAQASIHVSFLYSVLPAVEQNYVVQRDKKQQECQLNFSVWLSKNVLFALSWKAKFVNHLSECGFSKIQEKP